MNKFYVSTAIAYVNGIPHIGHALEFVQADVLARFHRMLGDETFYLTGTDEHGVKIYETAKESGEDTQAFVDNNADKFLEIDRLLNLSNDFFVRTSSDLHKQGARKLWEKMQESGDIYMDTYKGNYCVGCEAFIPEKDLDEEGNCPIHKKKPQILEEENYFFRLSRYSDQIKEAISTGKLQILPESRKKEMLNIIGEGLHDVSFSRPKSVLPWGIEVPGDSDQVMYVWCDALSNYITALGYGQDSDVFKKFWPCDAHVIGKDILRFHAGIWIGMLFSAGIELPKAIYVHGFVTSDGQKMSKSLGNVVDPKFYLDEYGSESLRYFLIREVPTTDDGDFTHGRFLQVYNSELANGLGNLVNRVVMMTEKYCDGKVPEPTSAPEFFSKIEEMFIFYRKSIEAFDLKAAVETLVALVDLGNKYIDDKKPWLLAKEAPEEVPDVMYRLIEILRFIRLLAMPIMPYTAELIGEQISVNEQVFELKWGQSKKGAKVQKGAVLFPRLEK